MSPIKPFTFLIAVIVLAALACSISTPAPAPRADPNAFNTMVAQTVMAHATIPPAVTAPPSLPPPPTIAPTQGPPVLVSATVNLPRHTALDFETKAVSGVLADTNKINKNLRDPRYYSRAPAGFDLVYYSENPTDLSWQFLYPVNSTRVAILQPNPPLQASYDGCLRAFRGEGIVIPGSQNEAFPLDSFVFVTNPGSYYCFTTDRGYLGTFKLTAPADYKSMAYVIVDYILWDAGLP